MIPTRVTFKGLTRRADIETVIQQEVASLAGHYHRIVDCRIRVEVPDRHQGAGNPVHVLIELTVPGDRLVSDYIAERHEGARSGGGGPKLTRRFARPSLPCHGGWRTTWIVERSEIHPSRTIYPRGGACRCHATGSLNESRSTSIRPGCEQRRSTTSRTWSMGRTTV